MGSYTTYSIKERIVEDMLSNLNYGLDHDVSQEEWKRIACFLLGELRAEGFYLIDKSEEKE